MTTVAAKHILHSGIFHPLLREWQSPNVEITARNLMYPIFVLDDADAKDPISSMPGIYRYGINSLKPMLEPLIAKGLQSVLLFGVPNHLAKDRVGTNADSSGNPVIQALKLLRVWFPNLLIACDVCLCPYTDHGHCGILRANGYIDNEASIKRISEIAVKYAQAGKNTMPLNAALAVVLLQQVIREYNGFKPSMRKACSVSYFIVDGAQIIAPSDMMDGRIGAIKKALEAANMSNQVAVLSYAVKFASGLYGPFRDASKSAPRFGDRKCYQLPPGSNGLATRAAARDIAEGVDMLMVKPGLAYLDVVRHTKDTHPEYPLFVYQVSGEYAMLYHGAQNGAINLEIVLNEVLLSMRRAGADCIITYFTPLILDMLHPKSKY